MSDKVLYRCPECGLHYEDERIAKQCEAFCKEHKGCSLEITKLSVERSGNEGFSHVILVLLVLLLIIFAGLAVAVRSNGSNNSKNSGNSSRNAASVPYTDKFITAVPFDLSQIASISKFRSCSGHDYSSANVDGQQETNRSMKHYINPLDSLVGTTNVIKIFAPFDGRVAATTADSGNNAQVGLQVWLTPTSSPAWSYIFYHITPIVKAGDGIKAGQLIGYANFSRSSVIDFDSALEAWVQNENKPLGPGNLNTLSRVLQHNDNYLQLLHVGQLDSVFNHMDANVLAQFSARGITPRNIIVSKAARDASPCPQPTDGVHYQSTPSDNVPLM